MSVTSSSEGNYSETDLEWITIQKNINESSFDEKETTKAKFSRKLHENPFVPIGCLATAIVLGLGLRSVIKGNRELSQKMMRYRVLAQGMTLGAIMVGVFTAGNN